MPKNKKLEDSESDSDSDSGREEHRPVKKAKKDEGNSKPSGYNRPPKSNDDGSVYWDFGMRKRVTVRDFKGVTYVDIREFYEKDGKTLPGKKGISMKAGDWGLLKDMMDDIDHALRSR
jgi:hypothetical protein